MPRTKGSKGIKTYDALELANRLGVDPLEFMLKMVDGDHAYFGFDQPNKISYTNAGIEFEEPNLKMENRVTCAKEAAKYLYSTKSAVQVSTGPEGLIMKVFDYTGKKKN